jgi:hypothetical protein
MLENKFQAELIKDIKKLLVGCIILKNDSHYIQGIPDLLILYQNKWAALEVKRSANEVYQPNQEYYIENLRSMSFATFVYPENKEVVLDDLQNSFGVIRPTCLFRR